MGRMTHLPNDPGSEFAAQPRKVTESSPSEANIAQEEALGGRDRSMSSRPLTSPRGVASLRCWPSSPPEPAHRLPAHLAVAGPLRAQRRPQGRKPPHAQHPGDAQRKAQAWAEKLARENKLYHSTLPDGIKVKWCSIGENVGYGPSVPAIEDAYMKSPGHKANIMNTKWNGVGVGYATNGNRIFTVQVFIKTC